MQVKFPVLNVSQILYIVLLIFFYLFFFFPQFSFLFKDRQSNMVSFCFWKQELQYVQLQCEMVMQNMPAT